MIDPTLKVSVENERQKAKVALIHRRLELRKLARTMLSIPIEEGMAAIGDFFSGEHK
jgi:hypothetical protein